MRKTTGTKPRPKKPARAEGKRAAPRESGNGEIRIGLLEMAGLALLTLLLVWAMPYLDFLGEWSYPGAFILGFLSSVGAFVPTFPLQFAVASMARTLDPTLLGILAGVGSGIGELSGFVVGRSSAKILKKHSEKSYGWLMKIQTDLLKRAAGPGLFVLAIIPNPLFDMAGILAGLAGMRGASFLFWCTAGRIVRFLVLTHLGAAAFHMGGVG